MSNLWFSVAATATFVAGVIVGDLGLHPFEGWQYWAIVIPVVVFAAVCRQIIRRTDHVA